MKKLLIFLTLICILLTGCGQKTDFSSTLIVPSKDIEEPFRLSETESGVYGFLVDTDENGDYYIVSHGETVTIEMLEG